MNPLTLIIGNRNYSSWSLRAWLVLVKAGLEFETRRLALDTEEFTREIPRYSPSQLVPVLHDGDLVIWDSLAIAEHVNERHAGHDLWPADPDSRSLARAVTAEMHSGFAELRNLMPMNIRARQRAVESTAALESDIARVAEIWRDCLQTSAGPWLFGSYTIADAFFAPVVFRFNSYGISLQGKEAVYQERVLADPDLAPWISAAEAEPETIGHAEVG